MTTRAVGRHQNGHRGGRASSRIPNSPEISNHLSLSLFPFPSAHRRSPSTTSTTIIITSTSPSFTLPLHLLLLLLLHLHLQVLLSTTSSIVTSIAAWRLFFLGAFDRPVDGSEHSVEDSKQSLAYSLHVRSRDSVSYVATAGESPPSSSSPPRSYGSRHASVGGDGARASPTTVLTAHAEYEQEHEHEERQRKPRRRTTLDGPHATRTHTHAHGAERASLNRRQPAADASVLPETTSQTHHRDLDRERERVLGRAPWETTTNAPHRRATAPSSPSAAAHQQQQHQSAREPAPNRRASVDIPQMTATAAVAAATAAVSSRLQRRCVHHPVPLRALSSRTRPTRAPPTSPIQ